MNRNTPLDTLVRHCDPADAQLTDGARARQEALLRRLLSEPQPAYLVRRPPRRHAPTWRWLVPVLILVVLLGIVGGVGLGTSVNPPQHAPEPEAVPAIGDRNWPHHDDWTQEATSLDGTAVEDLERACIDYLRLDEEGKAIDPKKINWLIAERRGSWELAVYSLPEKRNYLCYTPVTRGHAYPEIFEPHKLPAARTDVAPDQVSVPPQGVTCGVNYVEKKIPVCVWGAVGSRVKQVTLRSHHQTVHATVMNGYYAAWWPVPRDSVRPLDETPQFDLTLDDGTVLRDAQPLR